MEASLSFDYDEVGDILYINKVAPYPAQDSEQLTYNVLARKNPSTRAVENIEILFFTRWMLKGAQPGIAGLPDLFREPQRAAHS